MTLTADYADRITTQLTNLIRSPTTRNLDPSQGTDRCWGEMPSDEAEAMVDVIIVVQAQINGGQNDNLRDADATD